jgi:primosomal protein N' (replication factor Y)
LPDFRAAERTFQLVTQVAGRTGRGAQGGRVLVQTFAPDAPAIVAAVRHDYAAFARAELPQRQALGYPPTASMVRIVVRGESEPQVKALAGELAEQLRTKGGEPIRVLGPAPAPMAKLRGQYRHQIQLQAADGALLRGVARAVMDKVETLEGLVWTVDVDPWDMM